MGSYFWILIFFAAGMTTFANSRDYWQYGIFKCHKIKQKLESNEVISDSRLVVRCIFDCFKETTRGKFVIKPEQCFNVLVQPYITKVLKQEIPTEDEMKRCLNAKDRSGCKDILLYFFSKWYKDNYSADHYKKFAVLLFNSWAHIPDITRAIEYGNWQYEIGNALLYIDFENEQSIQSGIKVTSPSDPLLYPIIQQELKRYCYRPITKHTSKIFCRLRIVLNVAYKIYTLAKGKQKYGKEFQKYVSAVKSNFVPFSVLYKTDFDGSNQDKISLLDQQLSELARLTRVGNTQKMKILLQFMPETYLLEKACKVTTSGIVARRCCILNRVVEQLLIYSSMAEKRKATSKRKAVTINFSLNLRSVITELRGEELFKVTLDNKYQTLLNQEGTGSLMEAKFGQLRNYFSKLQSFNMQKASADVGYVKGRIKYYQGKAQKAIERVKDHVGGVLRAALTTQGLELGEKVIKLTFAIAEACNPFKIVFNGGTATDIMDALGELMKAISKVVEAAALQSAWRQVISTVKKINAGFQKNSEFLSAVGRIVAKIQINDFPNDDEFEQCKSTFLRLYNDYSPKVDKQMLAVLASNFDTSVESGCGLIDEATGSAATGYVAYVKKNLFCQKAAASTSSLKTIFEEIYDFQFEFIENMASYLRAATGFYASKKMATLAGKPMTSNSDAGEQRSELKANIIMAHATYEIQRQGVIESLCDFFEYKEGGDASTVCKGSTVDVPTLLSYIPKRCKSVNTYVSIPTSSLKTVPPGHINIRELYSGAEVSFDIPSYDWMRRHKWVGPADNFKAIYVRSFEVYLPSVVEGENKVKVIVRSMGGNKFKDGGTKYTLIPSEAFSVVYTGGNRYYPCSGTNIENPYNICEDRKLPNLCVMSDVPDFDDTRRLYPTTFARFKIKAKGILPSQTPDAQTPLHIKAKINMCVFDTDETVEKKSSLPQKSGCCNGNNYWNEAQGACQACAEGSTSNLNGFYCEKNPNALSPSKKTRS